MVMLPRKFGKWLNNELPYNPAIPLGYVTKRNENICPQKNMCMDAHSNIIHNSQKVETTPMSIN